MGSLIIKYESHSGRPAHAGTVQGTEIMTSLPLCDDPLTSTLAVEAEHAVFLNANPWKAILPLGVSELPPPEAKSVAFASWPRWFLLATRPIASSSRPVAYRW